MKFDPQIHTKEFLLQYPDVAIKLAENSPVFINSIAQDESYFLQAAKKSVGEFNPCEVLAKSPLWAKSPAAQNKNIISAVLANGSLVAITLASSTDWACSPIAQNPEVLRLSNKDGFSVGHALAANSYEWGLTPAAQDRRVLVGHRLPGSGEAVAHYLAKYNSGWLSTPRAYDRDILSLTATITNSTVLDQALFGGLTLNPKIKSELLTRPVKCGDATFLKGSMNCLTPEICRDFLADTLDHIDNSPNLEIKAQLVAALYSSLVNMISTPILFATSVEAKSVVNALSAGIHQVEPMLLKLAAEDIEFSMLMSGKSRYCNPAYELVAKIKNQAVFSSITALPESEIEARPRLY